MQYNRNRMWPMIAASMMTLTQLSFADTESAQMRHLENRVTALEQRKGASGVINPSGRPQVRNGMNLFFTGDVLLWQAHEDGLPLFIENKNNGLTENLNDAHTKNLDWAWDWGFRLGAGYNTPHDGWDLYLNWMRVYGRAKASEHVDIDDTLWPTLSHSGAVFNGVSGAGPYEKARAHWNLQLNQIDFELGREFFISKWMTLRPHIGLRTDWINQKLHLRYKDFEGNPDQDYELRLRNHFWGLGLAAGLDTQWGLGCGFSIFGNGSVACLYGFHKLDRDDKLSNDTSFKYVDLNDNYRISRVVGDLELGIRWDKMFQDDEFHLGLQAGWENHVYFGQNQFPRFVGDVAIGNMIANQGDLTFQGWTVSARFDF